MHDSRDDSSERHPEEAEDTLVCLWHISMAHSPESIAISYVCNAPSVVDCRAACEHSQRNELAAARVLADEGV